MTELNLAGLKEGVELTPIQQPVTQEDINSYARASGDFNPIHIDPEFARKSPLGGTIAHGMLILAYVSRMMTASFGENWLSHGRLNVRFKTPARPGDTVTVSGQVREVTRNGNITSVNCDILCQTQAGETVITGEAGVKIGENSG